MANFIFSYDIIMFFEGSYSNDPNDPGRETYKGISRINNSSWMGWEIIDRCKEYGDGFHNCLSSNNTLEQYVRDLYKKKYWDIFWGDSIIDQDIATEMFDIGVNIGPTIPIHFLQKSLNLLNRGQRDYPDIEVDGIMGQKTMSTLNNHPENYKYVYNILNIMQGNHYINCMNRNDKMERYTRGWLKRVSIKHDRI
jgi:lysozyme family protein